MCRGRLNPIAEPTSNASAARWCRLSRGARSRTNQCIADKAAHRERLRFAAARGGTAWHDLVHLARAPATPPAALRVPPRKPSSISAWPVPPNDGAREFPNRLTFTVLSLPVLTG